ncbi:3484_t:CDS:2 [Entrophospora sp. SA101]|nr:376_t:CDS:2 [Entrophospora sp. SA101]CAJ0747245.1 3484_t:CDS:2 [Entrophospora sp. SA101]
MQNLFQEIFHERTLTPEKQELAQAIMNFAQTFGNEDRWLKECLDILCDNKGNTLINKLLRHFSQKAESLVIVEDTGEIDDATYQKMKNRAANPGLAQEKAKEFFAKLRVEGIRAVRETLRKFALKAIDTETEIYTQIPSA